MIKNIVFTILISLCFSAISQNQSEKQAIEVRSSSTKYALENSGNTFYSDTREDIIQTHKLFINPPLSCLPAVYWFWNGKIEYEQIKWQLEEMKRSKTVESVCIMAWEGLEIEYLSDEWFDKVKYACKIAKDVGLHVCLYDEFLWPSGHAGGKLLDSNPEYGAKCLDQTEKHATGPREILIDSISDPVAIIAGKFNDSILEESSLTDITDYYKNGQLRWHTPEGEWTIFIYSGEGCVYIPAFFEQGYVDLLNPDLAKKFISMTHDEYYKRMPEYFGNVINAIITDEPGHYCNIRSYFINPGTISWTPSFFKEFEGRNNYDLRKFLPAIWNNIGKNTEKIRIDYYDTFGDLLQKSYFKTLHDWCNKHNIKLNIQPAHEETIKHSIILQGNYFKAMEYSHLPGGDEVYSWDKNIVTPKIISSAARSFGSQDAYCEVFAAYGWDITLERMKAISDWLFARGINRFQLSSYYFSMDGDWKMEIPPSLFHQNPFWKYLPNYTAYIQRLSYLLSGGRNISNIAILYPDKSVQAVLMPDDEQYADKIDMAFIGISNTLLRNQLDFDYLTEKTIVSECKVSTENDETALRFTSRDFWTNYEVLILPFMKIMEQETYNIIAKFYEKGGKVIAIGDLPQFTPAGESLENEANKIWHQAGINTNNAGGLALFVDGDYNSIIKPIQNNIRPDLKLDTYNESINYIHKVKNGLNIYFISNIDTIPVKTNISFSMEGIPQKWNAENGNIVAVKEYIIENNRTIIPLELDKYESLLIVFDNREKQAPHIVGTNMKIDNLVFQNDSVYVEALSEKQGENFITLEWGGKKITRNITTGPLPEIELNHLWHFEPEDKSFPAEIRKTGSWTEKQIISFANESDTASAHAYFSGTGIYSQKFNIDEPLTNGELYILEISQANDVVELWINEKKVGERCWGPLKFNITDFLVQGENIIKIMITNTMANKMMLDTRQYQHGEKWGKVAKSGLTGSVHINRYNQYEFLFSQF